jgi:hypothetical protein
MHRNLDAAPLWILMFCYNRSDEWLLGVLVTRGGSVIVVIHVRRPRNWWLHLSNINERITEGQREAGLS